MLSATSAENRRLHEVELFTSVWSINPVNPILSNDPRKPGYNSERHPAPFPESLAYRLIELYSKRGDRVLDPFCGTGTTNAVALKMGRASIGYDINPGYIKTAKERCGPGAHLFCKPSKELNELQDGSVDLCVTSPPYLDLKVFSNLPEDISSCDKPYQIIEQTIREIYRVLKKGGRLCINVCDVQIRNGVLSTFPYDLIYMCRRTGFVFNKSIIWKKPPRLKQWNIDNEIIRNNHEYVWVFVK